MHYVIVHGVTIYWMFILHLCTFFGIVSGIRYQAHAFLDLLSYLYLYYILYT